MGAPTVSARAMTQRFDQTVKKLFPETTRITETVIDLAKVDPLLAGKKLAFPHVNVVAAMARLLSDPARSGPRSEHLDLTQSVPGALSSGEFAKKLQSYVDRRTGALLSQPRLLASMCLYLDKVCALTGVG